MSNIVDITEVQPYKVSEVICVKCGHRWIAVRLSDTKLRELECPNCTKRGYAIETGEGIDADDCNKCAVRFICSPYKYYWQQDTRRKPTPGQKGCRILSFLPENHGRLVDADAVESIIRKWLEVIKLNPDILLDGVKSLPTIVPAERNDE